MASEGEEQVHTIYVNGILYPKDEVDWAVMEDILVSFFGGKAYHVHNPFLSIENPDQLVLEAVRKNPRIAAVAGLGIFALSFFSSDQSKQAMKKALFYAVESVALEHAVKHSPKITKQIREILKIDEETQKGKKYDELTVVNVNIFAHSHGGMVLDHFLKSDDLLQIFAESALKGVHLKVNLFVAGCPKLVEIPEEMILDYVDQINIKQLHNGNDVISLMFYYRNDANRKLPKYVVPIKFDGIHCSKLYAQSLSLCFENKPE